MAGSSEGASTSAITPRRIAAGVLFVLFVVFILQNRPDVTVQLLGLSMTGPVWVMLLGSFIVGGLVVWLLLARRSR